jgi:DNA invertase Pin-like site-specific DNA recombinase
MTPQRAILLVRISDDRDGEGLGVARQEVDGRAHAARLRWGIAEVIVENDTSAFKRRKVVLPDGSTAMRTFRPGLRRSLALLSTGERDGLLAYDLDRYTRDPRDLEDLIDVVEQRHVPVTSVTGSLRLDTDADITMARVMVAVANKSSRDTARRVSRKHEELAEKGRPSGGGLRPFGYEPDGMTVRGAEAAAVRRMADLLIGGESIRSVVRALNAGDVPPPHSATWTTRGVRNILGGARITGLRVFRGEVAGEATWPAILEREVWEQVQVRLKDRRSKGDSEDNALVHWLNGLLECGLCGRHLVAWGPVRDKRYWCARDRGGCGKISINARRSEAEVWEHIGDYFKSPEVLASLRGTFASDSVASARAELAEDEQQLKQLAAMWARRELTFPEYSEARSIIAARIKESRALVTSALPGVVRAFLAGDPAEEWESLNPADRRDLVRAVVVGYRVMPAGPGRKVFDPTRMIPIPHA